MVVTARDPFPTGDRDGCGETGETLQAQGRWWVVVFISELVVLEGWWWLREPPNWAACGAFLSWEF